MRRTLVSVVLVLASMPSIGAAGPLTQDACSGTISGPQVWKQLGSNVLENLLFADDSLWIGDVTAGSVRRFSSDGTEGLGLTGIPSPGGLVQRPDGSIYAGWGSSVGNALGGRFTPARQGGARVVLFDPADPNASMVEYARGFPMANGMALAANGDLFVSNDFDEGLVGIPADAPQDWLVLADVWGANGLVIDPAGENLYAAITFDQRSPIERIPLSDPAAHEPAAQLTFGAVSLEPRAYLDGDATAPVLGVKGLDDMTRDATGALYVVANGTGELLRVDPLTGASCLIAGGLKNPSSVRIAPEASAFADGRVATLDFYITEFSGAIRVVRWEA